MGEEGGGRRYYARIAAKTPRYGPLNPPFWGTLISGTPMKDEGQADGLAAENAEAGRSR